MAKDFSVLDKALKFATDAHSGVLRKGTEKPYIIHPIEAVAIVASLTDDVDLMAAAALHDVIEDTAFTYDDIKREFGERIARLVDAETDRTIEGKDKKESWFLTKTAALSRLKNADREVKTVAMGDKLSNMRAMERDYKTEGEKLWERFGVKEKSAHSWRYRALKDALKDLEGTAAYEEFCRLVDEVFPQE